MLRGKFGPWGIFALGFGLGTTAHKWWPVIKENLTPVGKGLLEKGMDLADKAKESFWDKSEKFADVIAEIKEDKEPKTPPKTKKKKAQPHYNA